MFYIRTGDRVTLPFKIRWWHYTFAAYFVLHTAWFTHGYFRYFWLKEQLEYTDTRLIDKYLELNFVESQIKDLNTVIKAADSTIAVIERIPPHEPPTPTKLEKSSRTKLAENSDRRRSTKTAR